MHPILRDRRALLSYIGVWAGLTAVFVAAIALAADRPFRPALLIVLPPAVVHAFLSLAGWYLARALPLTRAHAARSIGVQLVAAAVSSGLFVLLVRVSAVVAIELAPGISAEDVARSSPLIYTFGFLLYLLSAALHYVMLAFASARDAQARQLESRVFQRESELKALRAQLDPHFLFNSLNSISALCGSRPATAREMSILLAEYLRKSLRMSDRREIQLHEELDLASSYVRVEQVRFGDRLRFEHSLDPDAAGFLIPPLLIQPLVENAILHGIAHLVEGGHVGVAVTAPAPGAVTITVENDCDPDRPSGQGHGVGLTNVRRRIETFYGSDAAMQIDNDSHTFRVTLALGREDR